MTLQTITAATVREVTFSYRLGGIEATYTRFLGGGRIADTTLNVYPLSLNTESIETVDGRERKKYSRVDVLVVDPDDLAFDGESFIPRIRDEISFTINGKVERCRVMDFSHPDESNIVINAAYLPSQETYP